MKWVMLMFKKTRINDLFPNWLTAGGIFTALQSCDVPWKSLGISTNLDIIYHGNRSGRKVISPILENLVSDSDTLSSDSMAILAAAICAIYNDNWAKLYTTLSFDYNPIENYAMTESEIENGENSGTHSGTVTGTGSVTNARNIYTNGTTENTNGVYGFNSSSAVDSDTQAGNATQKGTDTNTETRDTTDTTESKNSETNSKNRTLTRSGNIGVTTSQEMIQAERDLWKWFFYDTVFQNIDEVLALQVY